MNLHCAPKVNSYVASEVACTCTAVEESQESDFWVYAVRILLKALNETSQVHVLRNLRF